MPHSMQSGRVSKGHSDDGVARKKYSLSVGSRDSD